MWPMSLLFIFKCAMKKLKINYYFTIVPRRKKEKQFKQELSKIMVVSKYTEMPLFFVCKQYEIYVIL